MEKKSDTSSVVSPGTRDEETESSVSHGAVSEGSSSSSRPSSHTADLAENLIGLASEAILRFKMEAESKSRMETDAPVTKDVAVSLGNIFKFVVASDEIAQTFVSVVVQMEDFMKLLFNLIQQCIVSK